VRNILVIGGVTVDTLLYMHEFPDKRPATVFSRAWRRTVGGTGAGKAMALAKLGFGTDIHAFVGDDPEGEMIGRAISASGARLHASVDPKGTETHVNLMNDAGERISIYANYATSEPEIEPENFRDLVLKSDAVVLNISNYVRRFIPLARALGKEIWTDIHDYDGNNAYHRDFIAAADHLFLSSDSLPGWRAFMADQIGAGKKTVVCTHGKRGASAMDASGKLVEVAATPKFGQIDTNGAGDSFFAGFMAAAARNLPLADRMRWGAVAGALAVASPELVHEALSPEKLEKEALEIYGGNG
jgi:sugar/nucleoside kinase (ribokinase family)